MTRAGEKTGEQITKEGRNFVKNAKETTSLKDAGVEVVKDVLIQNYIMPYGRDIFKTF